jgi:molybdopterin molybdotransferase
LENPAVKAPLLPVADALARILAGAKGRARHTEVIRVERADGRVLARDCASLRTQPPRDVSAMDGFGLRAADTPGKPLTIVGESAAGHPFSGQVGPGEAVRINTGAYVPEGVDAVLMVEQAEISGEILVSTIPCPVGAHIRRAGQDFARGALGLGAGTRLTPGRIALLGGMNHAEVSVFRAPKIAILATGDELVAPGAATDDDQIIATNAFAIGAMARRAGALTRDFGIAKDTEASLHEAFDAMRDWGADVLVTIGGASVGAHDLVKPVAAARGASLDFYKIAMRPGKPLNFGAMEGALLLGLPGNPVSSFVCARLFLLPLVAALSGDARAGSEVPEAALLGAPCKPNDERADYLRGALSRDGAGALVATPHPRQDSSLLSAFAEAEVLIIRAPHAPRAEAGERVEILHL